MPEKKKMVSFYHLEARNDDIVNRIDEKLVETYDYLRTHRSDLIRTIRILDNDFYIQSMDRSYPDDNNPNEFAWEFNISRLDTNSPVDIGNLDIDIENRNETLPVGENQGPVVNTAFLYDPNTKIIAFSRTQGGTSKIFLKQFLSQFCEIRGLLFAVVPDEIAINQLDLLRDSSRISYAIANVDQIQAEDAQDELKDIEYAHDVGASGMEITLNATALNLNRIRDKATFLYRHAEELDLKKLEVIGTQNDGHVEPLDLVQHKLSYTGNLIYDHFITVQNTFAFLDVAYARKYEFLRAHYYPA